MNRTHRDIITANEAARKHAKRVRTTVANAADHVFAATGIVAHHAKRAGAYVTGFAQGLVRPGNA